MLFEIVQLYAGHSSINMQGLYSDNVILSFTLYYTKLADRSSQCDFSSVGHIQSRLGYQIVSSK